MCVVSNWYLTYLLAKHTKGRTNVKFGEYVFMSIKSKI